MPDSRPSFKEIFREIPFWILLVVTIAFFWRPLFFGETFFFRDIYNHIYAQKKLFAELVLSGQLPLWDPYRHGGQPFLANMNNSVLYPSNLLYLIMPIVTALNIDIVLHIALSALAAYMLARVLGFSPFAAAASGLVYAFCGPSLSLPNIWPYAALHPPLMLLFWHLYCLEKNKSWFLLTVLVGAIQIFAGHPEMTAITFAILIIWTFAFPYQRNFFVRIMQLLIAMIAIFGIAAIQLIPMAELVHHSSRSQGIRPDIFFAWSVDPKRYPELLFSGFLGSIYSLSQRDQWGLALEELSAPYILSLYFGVPALILAIFGGLNKNSNNELPRRIRTPLLILIAFSFFAMGGRHIPGFRNLIDTFPAITIFRYPVKFVVLTILPIALLAGYQLNHLRQNLDQRNLRKLIAVASFFATSLAILMFVLITFPSMSSHFLGTYFSSDGSAALKGIRSSVLHTTAVSILFTLCISLASVRNQPRLIGLLSFLIALDLLLAGVAVNHYAPREFFTDIPTLASYIKKEIGDGKLYRDPDYASVDNRIPSNDIVFRDRWRLEMLSDYTASLYGIPVVFHDDYDWLEDGRMLTLARKFMKHPWNRWVPVFSSAGVRFILTSKQIRIPGLHLVESIKNSSNTTYFLYRNDGCAGRAFFVSNSKIERDSNKMIEIMTDPAFDPRTMVALEETTFGAGKFGVNNASLRLNKSTSGASSYLVISDKPGFLVFSEPYSTGWKWSIDGWTVQSLRANFAFTAVAVPAGRHQVDRIYRPVSFVVGCAISLIALTSLILSCIIKAKIKVQNETVPSAQNHITSTPSHEL